MGDLYGKVAVITGGTRGLGFGIARALSRAGAAVVVASRSQNSVDEAVQLVRSEGGQASGMVVDVANLEDMERLAHCAISKYDRLDIWVNNAGSSGPYGPTLELDPQDFNLIVRTNIIGVYYGSRTAMEYFIKQQSGKLINVLGRGYERPVPWQNAYGASKAWMLSFTKALANETKDSGVGVFAFNPGMVLTEMLTDVKVIEGAEERLTIFPTIVRMWARPAEIPAKKVVWLASAATDGKTGLLVNSFSPWVMLGGALKEGCRVLTNKPAKSDGIKIEAISPYKRDFAVKESD
ncbi:MAG: SDR family oxidoreductase [Anaerolineales bacterium]|nr:SDR family oxidoreductase [Anaerolineales bacterium]